MDERLFEERQRTAAALAELNNTYTFANDNGKSVVLCKSHDPVLNQYVFQRIRPNDFLRMYENKKVLARTEVRKTRKGEIYEKEIWLPLGQAWLSSEDRSQKLGGVVFDPQEKAGPEFLNLWQGFAIEPKPHEHSVLTEFIFEVICDGNFDHYQYLIGWLAKLFQKPWDRGNVAVVLKGKKGVGKNTFADIIMKICGMYSTQISKPDHAFGRFNAHLQHTIFLFLNEAYWVGDKSNEATLKTIITEEHLFLEAKGFAPFKSKNMVHALIAANADWVVPASFDERRFFFLTISDRYMQNKDYFAGVRAAIEDEAVVGGFLHALLQYDLNQYNEYSVPQTEGLIEQKAHSLTGAERWLLEVLKDGTIGEKHWPETNPADCGGATRISGPCVVEVDYAYQAYCAFAASQREYQLLPKTVWGKHVFSALTSDAGAVVSKIRGTDSASGKNGRFWGYRFADLQKCRAAFEMNLKMEGYFARFDNEFSESRLKLASALVAEL